MNYNTKKNRCFNNRYVTLLLNILVFLGSTHLCAQVGVNTTNPDGSSILDVVSTEKGMLVPRINLTDVTITQLDGVNTAATGLLIYNINASVTGGNGAGFYMFNGLIWEKITTTSDTVNDIDFYISGTTDTPNTIADEIYTNGALGINTDPTSGTLDINSSIGAKSSGVNFSSSVNSSINTTVNAINANLTGSYTSATNIISHLNLQTNLNNSLGGFKALTGIDNDISTTGLATTGIYTSINASGSSVPGARNIGVETRLAGTNAATQYGHYTVLNSDISGNKTGVYTEVRSGTGIKFGAFYGLFGSGATQEIGNFVSILNGADAPIQTAYRTQMGSNTSSVKKGLDLELYNGTGGTQYGAYISLNNGALGNTAALYGTYINIPSSTNSNIQYGVYSDVRKSVGYAGYFLGRVSIGSALTNNYVLPTSRGTNGQIMQTDGSGTVSWVDNSSTSFWSRSGAQVDVANAADDVSFSSDQTSIIFPTTSGSPSTMIHLFESGTNNSDRMVFSQSPSFSNWGLMYRDFDDSFRFLRSGADRVVVNLNSTLSPLVVNGRVEATDFQSATATYPDYVFESVYKGVSQINPNYDFKDLDEVEVFIKREGHLPGVRSFKDVKLNNMQINLTETSVMNLEKIEELFIHAITLKKENEDLKKRYKLLEERLQNIERMFEKMN